LDQQPRSEKIVLRNKKINFFLFLLVLFLQASFGQSTTESFLNPADSINVKRKNTVFITEAVVASAALIGLNQLWYADYPKSDFHFVNDNSEWLQMDKVGHFYSSYQMGRLGAEMIEWSGASKKNQLIYGSGLGFAFLTAVEAMDGFSSEWGASAGDVIANASGTALYVSQELLWDEQRIIPKFSFHTTQYAKYRPDVLGHSFAEQLLKDYNGQTYWLSANLHSFFKDSKIPQWLNLAVGYGADGMISGDRANANLVLLPNTIRTRQFYLSFDVDLTKIKTQSNLLKTVFSVVNTIKIPAPTLEIKQFSELKVHFIYF
jgi:hypothetical protein